MEHILDACNQIILVLGIPSDRRIDILPNVIIYRKKTVHSGLLVEIVAYPIQNPYCCGVQNIASYFDVCVVAETQVEVNPFIAQGIRMLLTSCDGLISVINRFQGIEQHISPALYKSSIEIISFYKPQGVISSVKLSEKL